MLQQNILGEKSPYQLFVSEMGAFPAHRHADIEFSYCLEGEYEVVLDRRHYTVRAGDLVLVAPMVTHEILPPSLGRRRVLTAVLGPSLLREEYAVFAAAPFRTPVIRPEELTADHASLREALWEAAALSGQYTPAARLARTAALFRIMALLCAALPTASEEKNRDLQRIAAIEPALELIWHSYRTPLTVEMAAAATGYGKSNFCKIFRAVTGETFHHALNRRRIAAARDLLRGTALPIATVAAEVGIPEAKTFSRVFYEVEGVTPREYRSRA